jgi:ATP-dependent DNA ligase
LCSGGSRHGHIDPAQKPRDWHWNDDAWDDDAWDDSAWLDNSGDLDTGVDDGDRDGATSAVPAWSQHGPAGRSRQPVVEHESSRVDYHRPVTDRFAVEPPIEPMLAKAVDALPSGGDFLYEPKWDGFRAIVFRGSPGVFIQSRDLRPFDRYFPELHEQFGRLLPPGCVVDGEIVIATPRGLDFSALQQRLHPAASRVALLAKSTPASFVGFDLLAIDGRDIRSEPQRHRRALLERLLADVPPPVRVTAVTTDRELAADWLQRFEGAGLDGVVAKHIDLPYTPGKRVMFKIKHARSADCVVAGFRWHKSGPDAVGSLLLGLYDDNRRLHHVGVTSSFTMAARRELVKELEPLRKNALQDHPWRDWAEGAGDRVRMPGGQSRWSAGKDLSWEPLRIARVVEVKYDHLQGDRFRHATTFVRWRPDKPPEDCRYDQLEVTTPFALDEVFAAAKR